MDIISRLRESNGRLIGLENQLDSERAALINHEANNRNQFTSNSMHFNYLSLVEKYTGFADDYNKELSVFKDLLKQSVNLQSSAINNFSNVNINNNNEITSNYLPTSVSLSSPVVDKVSYITNDDSNTSSTDNNSSRGIASTNTTISTQQPQQQYIEDVEEEETEPVTNEQVLTLPKIQPKPQINSNVNNTASMDNYHENKYNVNDSNNNDNNNEVTVIYAKKKKTIPIKVSNKLSYKYEGLGFDIWKKNGRRAIYTMTELYCYKTFGDDDKGLMKLKKYLVRGGFKENKIERVQVFTNKKSGYKYGLIQVRDSQNNINTAMDKMNSKGGDNVVIEFKIKREYNARRAQNKKLFVKNFDIMSDKDHYAMTKLFYRFGDLENDIFMSRDKNGDPYCFVHFRDIQDAIACEKNQNWKSRYNTNRDPLWFNGRELNIQYVDDSKNGTNNNKKRKNTKSKRSYNSRR